MGTYNLSSSLTSLLAITRTHPFCRLERGREQHCKSIVAVVASARVIVSWWILSGELFSSAFSSQSTNFIIIVSELFAYSLRKRR